jgi:arylsulfatase A-like enzyme
MTDDQRWDSLDVMPATLERLAGEGILFTNSFVTTPLCGPSRASFLTGQAVRNNGVDYNSVLLFDPSSTLATWAQDAGYRTAMIGKYLNHYHLQSPEIPPGWDHWNAYLLGGYYNYELNENGVIVSYGDRPEDYSTDVLRDDALRFIDENADAPFLLFLSLFTPHIHAVPAPRHEGLLADTPPWRPPSFFENDLSDKPGWVKFVRQLRIGGGPLAMFNYIRKRDEAHVKELESLLAVDDAIAAILDRLEDHGLDDDTIVVFTSDNGLHWGEHYLGGKYNGYEESIRVPLVIRYPRLIPEAREEDALALNIDLAPTLAELAGIPASAPVDGDSMVDLLCGDVEGWREDFALEYFIPRGFDGMPAYIGYRSQRWKYLVSIYGFEELYDLEGDPNEMDNLLRTEPDEPSHGERVNTLRDKLIALRAEPMKPPTTSRRPVRSCWERDDPAHWIRAARRH